MVKDRKYKFKLFTMREFVTNAKKIFYQGYQDFMVQSLYQIRSFFSRRENRTLFEKFSATNVLNYRDKVSSIQSSRRPLYQVWYFNKVYTFSREWWRIENLNYWKIVCNARQQCEGSNRVIEFTKISFLIMLFNHRDFKLDRFYPSWEITIRVIDGG